MAGAQGRTTIDFGAFPGETNIAVELTGQATIADTAEVDVWLVATPTADHSADEHVVDGPNVLAGAVTPGAGFTIYASARNERAYGLWSVAWVWRN
jgi:hypothetical protein